MQTGKGASSLMNILYTASESFDGCGALCLFFKERGRAATMSGLV
jgi:hypothetical protein